MSQLPPTLPHTHLTHTHTHTTYSPKWVPDEEYPFQPPKHLREAIEQFETSEVLGLVPRPPPPQAADKNENEYIYSYVISHVTCSLLLYLLLGNGDFGD